MFSWGELFSTFMVRKIMGIKGTCRSANRGGPFCMLPNSKGAFILPALHKGKRASNQGKIGQKLDFICSLWCFLGDFGDRKRQKPNIFLKCGAGVGLVVRCLSALIACPLGRSLQAVSISFGVFPAFCPLYCFCFPAIALKYGSISHFNAVFSVVWGWCVGLYCWRALRGLWGFCVREWLGG